MNSFSPKQSIELLVLYIKSCGPFYLFFAVLISKIEAFRDPKPISEFLQCHWIPKFTIECLKITSGINFLNKKRQPKTIHNVYVSQQIRKKCFYRYWFQQNEVPYQTRNQYIIFYYDYRYSNKLYAEYVCQIVEICSVANFSLMPKVSYLLLPSPNLNVLDMVIMDFPAEFKQFI